MKSVKGLIIIILVISLIVISTAWFFMHTQLIKFYNDLGAKFSDIRDSSTSMNHVKAIVNNEAEVDGVIPTKDVVFTIAFADEVTEEYVKNTFSIEKNELSPSYNEIKSEINKIDKKNYALKVIDKLDEGAVYNVIEKTEDGTNKWAFQTEKRLTVKNSYPSEVLSTANGCPDFSLNFTPIENISDYVSVEPAIPGYWEKSGSYYYFRHSNDNFEYDKEYTVTVHKGMHDIYGNKMDEDHAWSFHVEASKYSNNGGNNSSDYNDEPNSRKSKIDNVIIQSENAFKTGEKISFDISLLVYLNKNDSSFDISSNEYKIFNLSNEKEYLKILHTDAESLWDNKNYTQITTGKLFNDNLVYKDVENPWEDVLKENTIQTDFSSEKEGYYVIVARVGEDYDYKPFQINNTIVSASFSDTKEAFIVVKNAKDARVYINDISIGKVDKDGVLYVENALGKVGEPNEYDYLEVRSDSSENLVLDITKDLYEIGYYDLRNSKDNTVVTRFNNGYLYHDRPVYRVGETINFWGYARNRVYGLKEATIEIEVNSQLLVDEKLKLNKMGCFTYQYELNEVNPGSYVEASIYIDGYLIDSRYLRIEDYSTREYVIDIERDGNRIIVGNSSNISISANTYDGVPLANTDFNVSVPDSRSNSFLNTVSNTITTDLDGNGTGRIDFNLKDTPSTTDSERLNIRVENSLLDGGYEYLNYTVYPYKNDANMFVNYNKESGEYSVDFREFNVLDKDIVADDEIYVVASAKSVHRIVEKTYYDEYTKTEKKQYKSVYDFHNEYNKTFTIKPVDGKATLNLKNWSDGINEKGYYRFFAYIKSDLGVNLLFSQSDNEYTVYGYDMWDEKKTTSIKPVEIVAQTDSGELIEAPIEEKDKRTKDNDIPMYELLVSNQSPNFGDEVELRLIKSKDESYYSDYDEYYYDGYYYNDYYYDEYDDYYSEVRNNTTLQGINDYSGIEMYALMISGRGVEILKSKNAPIKFTYNVKMGANVSFYVVVYDGEKAYSLGFSNIYYAYEDLSEREIRNVLGGRSSNNEEIQRDNLNLDLKVTFDKEVYKPGDEATITIKTSCDGKGISSGVNLSAVDTGYLDENGLTSIYIKRTLKNPYNFRLKERNSHAYNYIEYHIYEGGGGGGGDGDGERNKLLTTALFENVITDVNGNATIKVQLPDNITEWTITTQAISEDYRANSDIKTLVVTKDFYVDISNKSYYVENEKFAFNVKAIGKNYVGKTAKATVSILDMEDNILETGEIDLAIGKVSSYKIKEGLPKGFYKIKLSSEYEGHKDSIVKTIEVKKTLFSVSYREKKEFNNGDRIAVYSPQATLLVVNKDVSKILDDLMALKNNGFTDIRYDNKILSGVANDIYNMLLTAKFRNVKKNFYEEGQLYKLMDDSEYDVELLLRNIATKGVRFKNSYTNETILLGRAYEFIRAEKGEEAELWARACYSEPVLKELKNRKAELIEQDEISRLANSKEKVLFVALAFAEMGDYESATEIYDFVKSHISSKDDMYEYELLTTLAIKINSNERIKLYNDYKNTYAEQPDHLNYMKLYYIENELARNFKEGKLVLNTDGVNEDVEVKNIGLTRKFLTNASKYYIFDKSDNLDFWLEDYKDVEVDKFEEKGLITKNYDTSKISVGDIVTVTITINAKQLNIARGNESYLIYDVLPNNLTFIEILENQSSKSIYYNDRDGQKISFRFNNYYGDNYSTPDVVTIKYQVKVVNSGEQKETGVLLTTDKKEIVDLIKY